MDHPIRRVGVVGILSDIAKAQARYQGQLGPENDAGVLDGSPLAEEQIPRREEDCGHGLRGYGETRSWEDVSMLVAVDREIGTTGHDDLG